MGKETFYFSHDYNARSDERIRRLLWKHGMVGYGLFWAIVEDLYQNDNKLKVEFESLSYHYHVEIDVLKSVINDFELFVFQDDFFGSLSVQKRIDERNSKSLKARESIKYRWKKDDEYERNTNVIRTSEGRNTIKESKVKESKVKDIDKKSSFTPPQLTEVVSFFIEKGDSAENAQKAFEYYSVANWHDSKGNKVKNWKQKMLSTWIGKNNLTQNRNEPKLTRSEIQIESVRKAYIELQNPTISTGHEDLFRIPPAKIEGRTD